MILWTILPLEMVLADSEKVTAAAEIKRGSITMEAQMDAGHQYRIMRIISTDPMDYLKPELQPGRLIK